MSRTFFVLLLILLCRSHAKGAVIEVSAMEGDARAAVQAAVDGAGPGDVVRLGPGTFQIGGAPSGNWHLILGGRAGLALEGTPGATTLIFKHPRQGGIYIAGGSEMWLRNLVIDYATVPFTQGRVVSNDPAENAFVLELDQGYPSPGEAWFPIPPPYSNLGHNFGPPTAPGVPPRLKPGSPDYYIVKDWTSETARRWRIRLNPDEPGKAATLMPGDCFALLARGGDGALFFGGTRGGGVENVTIHASPGLTCSLLGCEAMTIRGLKILHKPGAGRLVASNGDGIHCQRNRQGPLIEDCVFEGLCDDGVNIYAPPLIVREVTDVAGVTELLLSGPEVRVGDPLDVFNPQAGSMRGRATATSVTAAPEGMQRVRLDAAIAGIQPGTDHRNADTAFNLAASGAGYVIRNNTFRNHRRHGLLLRSGDGLIEGNTFDHNGGFGVVVSNEPSWPEGPTAQNVIIRGNRFEAGGQAAGYADSGWGAAIQVRATGFNGVAAEPVQKNITIEGNTFVDPPGAAFFLGAAQGVQIIGNRVEYYQPTIGPAFILEVCQEVTMRGLVLVGNAPHGAEATRVIGGANLDLGEIEYQTSVTSGGWKAMP